MNAEKVPTPRGQPIEVSRENRAEFTVTGIGRRVREFHEMNMATGAAMNFNIEGPMYPCNDATRMALS